MESGIAGCLHRRGGLRQTDERHQQRERTKGGKYTVTLDFQFDSEGTIGEANCVIDPADPNLSTITMQKTGIKLGLPLNTLGTLGPDLLGGYVTMGSYGSTGSNVPVPTTDAPQITIRRVRLDMDKEY